MANLGKSVLCGWIDRQGLPAQRNAERLGRDTRTVDRPGFDGALLRGEDRVLGEHVLRGRGRRDGNKGEGTNHGWKMRSEVGETPFENGFENDSGSYCNEGPLLSKQP